MPISTGVSPAAIRSRTVSSHSCGPTGAALCWSTQNRGLEDVVGVPLRVDCDECRRDPGRRHERVTALVDEGAVGTAVSEQLQDRVAHDRPVTGAVEAVAVAHRCQHLGGLEAGAVAEAAALWRARANRGDQVVDVALEDGTPLLLHGRRRLGRGGVLLAIALRRRAGGGQAEGEDSEVGGQSGKTAFVARVV